MKWIFIGLITMTVGGCGVIEETIKRNDDLYATPGAMDSPLTGIYKTYQYDLLDRYRITHQWLESGCAYSALEQPSTTPGQRSYFYAVGDIYEDGNSTKQRGAHPAWNFDSYVRSVKQSYPVWAPTTREESAASVKATLEKARRESRTGKVEADPPSTRVPLRYEEQETGFEPICFESWWSSSHYLRLRLQKRTLKDMQMVFSDSYPEGQWTSKTVNGQGWLVQETSEDQMRSRPLNGLGGPYQSWLLPLGDTGYTMALEMGASKESLQYPQAHAAMSQVFRHLIESVKVEPLK